MALVVPMKESDIAFSRKRSSSKTSSPVLKRLSLASDWRSAASDSRQGGQSAKANGNPGYKTKMCYYVNSPDGCRQGDSCFYAHTSTELQKMDRLNDVEGQEFMWDNEYCPFFARGCCFYSGDKCWFKHEAVTGETSWKTMLCKEFMEAGSCSFSSSDNADTCKFAHGVEDLRTPSIHQGMPGYKCVLCTFYLLEETTCKEDLCFDAHGPLDLRNLPLALPRQLADAEACYSDAHVHLDHVLWTRRWGNSWFYKREPCRFQDCKSLKCLRAHSGELKPMLEVDRNDFETLASELIDVGVFGGCVHSCCEVSGISEALRYVRWGRELLKGKVMVTFGIHPVSFESYTPEVEARMVAALSECGAQGVGWGECGLDYYRRHKDLEGDSTCRNRMIEVFIRQIRIAVEKGWPLVVHSREADDDTMAVLQEHVPSGHPILIHSFTGSLEFLSVFTSRWSRGYIGITGCVTYRNAWTLYEIAEVAPVDRILLETDGPYMAPEPYRGYIAHPGHIPWIANTVARARGTKPEEILRISYKNFCDFYRL